MTSPTLTSQSKVALVFCPLWRRASSELRYIKLMGLDRSILYGLWSFVLRQVQTYFPWCANSHRETRYQVTIETTSWSILRQTISSLITKLRLTMVGSQELIFYGSQWWEGSICYSPTQEKHQWSSCWVRSFDTIICITAMVLDIQVTSMFKPYEDCALGKAKQEAVNKKAVP